MLIYTHRVCMLILWRFNCGSLFCFVLFFRRVLKGIGDGSDTKKKASATCFPNLQLLSAGSPYVVGEKRPTFSVKCLLRRQSTRECEQHNCQCDPADQNRRIQKLLRRAFRGLFQFCSIVTGPGGFFKVPKNRVTGARTILHTK